MTLRDRNAIAKPARYIQTIDILEPATYLDAMNLMNLMNLKLSSGNKQPKNSMTLCRRWKYGN